MKIKNIFNNENKTKIIGLLTILIAIWLILYFIPELFVSLFNTLLGNLILILTVLLVSANNKIYGLVTGLVVLILYRFSHISREKFTTKSERDFLLEQTTLNKQNVFDMNIINSQASQEELDYFNKNGMWPWSQDVIELYTKAINRNPYIRFTPKEESAEGRNIVITDDTNPIDYARKIYNQAAILRILSYQTKEGQFLLNGVLVKDPSGNKMEDLPSGFGNFPYEAGLLENRVDDVIKCSMKDEQNPSLERVRYTGKGGIFGEQTEKTTPVDYNDLEKIIPGFTFLNKPCNPCGALAAIPDYSCAYRLRVRNKPPFISDVWQYLWGINDNPLDSQPAFLTENINPNEFPLLSGLQNELQKQNKYQKPN
jgi:hypothetical protein